MDLNNERARIFINQKRPEVKETIQKEKISFEKGRNNKRLVKFLDWVINISLFAIFLGTPIFFTNLTYQGIAFEKQIYFYFWTLLALIAWASKSGYLGEMKIRKTPLDIPILLFWGSYLVSTIFSVDKWHSFFGFFGDPSRGFLNVTAFIVIYYLILNNLSDKLFRWLLRGIFIAGFIVSIWTFLVSMGIKFLPDTLAVYFPLSFVGSMGGVSLFLMSLIPLGIMRIFKIQEKDKGNKLNFGIFLHLFLIALNLFVVFTLFAYSTWLALLIGMVLFLVFVLAKIIQPKGSWAILPMIIFVLVLVFLMIGSVNLSRVSLPLVADVPFNTALGIAKESVKDNFFFGYGAANFGHAFSKNLPIGFDNYGVRFFQGQGLMLENIATIGVVGTVFFTILILTYLGSVLFLLTRDKENNKINSLGLVTASIILLVGVMTMRIEGSIMTLWLLISFLALAVVYMESKTKEKFINFSLKASPKFALTLAFIYLIVFAGVAFMFVFIGKVYVADLRMGSAARATEVSEGGSVASVIKAINVNPHEGRYYTRLGQEYMALTNQEMLKDEKDRDIEKIRYYLSLAIEAGKRGEELMPEDATNTEVLAQIYENAGLYVADAYDLARKKYERAHELEPFNPDFLLKIGQTKIKLSSFKESDDEKKSLWEEAKDDYQKAVEMRPNYPLAYYNLSLAQEGLGEPDKSIESMTQAFLLQRSNLNYAFNLARLYQARGKDDDIKIAESLYKQILGVNDKELNTHFSLGMLYEKNGQKNEAIAEYQRVIELLPDGSDQSSEQLRRMIKNIQNGVPNTVENLGLEIVAPQSTETQPASEETPEPTSETVEQPVAGNDVQVPAESPVEETQSQQ